MLTSSFWMARMRFLATSQFAFFPVMTIISELLFSAGRSILVLVSSRIYVIKRKQIVKSNRGSLETSFKRILSWLNEQYLLNVWSSFSNDVSVELLEDGDWDREAVLHLRKVIFLKVNTGPYMAINAILKQSLTRQKYLRWNISKGLPSQPLSSAWT